MGVMSRLIRSVFKAVAGSPLGRAIKEEVLLMAAEEAMRKACDALGWAKKGYVYDNFTQDFVFTCKVGTPECDRLIETTQNRYDTAVEHYEALSAGEDVPEPEAQGCDLDLVA